MKCNRDCFHCDFDDCISDEVSLTERIDQMQRDINAQSECKIPMGNRLPKDRRKGKKWDG